MMDINKVGVSNTVPTVPQQLSGQSVDKGSTGVYATIDNLIAMLQKMNIDIRDMERDFHAAGQQRAAAVQLKSIDTKLESIELKYKAAWKNASAKVLSGFLSAGGAAIGGVAGSGGDLMSTGLSGVGKAAEGGINWGTASLTRDAEQKNILGEFQADHAAERYKALSAAAEKAAEASSRMHDLTRQLMSMQERMMSVVKI
ncbi:hypothetical protein [Chromobacterium violaceum]|nr:hypothetical protein [Chromobacterium violaceum]SUX35773.1 Secretion system effector D [Chromobacterium violaceum]